MITGKARACSVFIEMQGVALWTKGKINKRFIRDNKKNCHNSPQMLRSEHRNTK